MQQIESRNILKITKIYESQKEMVINLIKEYLHNMKNTATGKEIIKHINEKLTNNILLKLLEY